MSARAEHFGDLIQQREAATLGMWTFLATEVLFFGALFLAYIVYRHSYPLAFAQASQHTLLTFGTINTAVLLTSSLTMALAIHAARQNRLKAVSGFLFVTIFLGCAFLVLKGFEYRADLHEHLWPGRNFKPGLPVEAQIFWFLYWLITGVHALHVTVGLVLLATMGLFNWRRKFSTVYHTPLEIVGLYWHFVDIVWIFVYPMLYLVHRYPA